MNRPSNVFISTVLVQACLAPEWDFDKLVKGVLDSSTLKKLDRFLQFFVLF